jgi:hypothetical protein
VIDLTGANLIGYLLRVIRDAVSRNPRFNSTLGQVTSQSNNMIQYGDTQVTVRDVTSSGNRLSPDYFMCNTYGRVLVAKVENKEGTFIEWTNETDKTRQTPEAGVYYLSIDAVNQETNDVDISITKFRWVEGRYNNAVGSIAYLRQGIDGTTLTAKDLATGDTVAIKGFSTFVILQVPTETLQLYDANNNPLVPLTDFWYQRPVSEVIIQSTVGGPEVANITTPWVSFTLTDQDGYELRQGIDWNFYGLNFIQLNTWSPMGSTITANVIRKLDPSTVSGTNPENILPVNILPNESLAAGQVFIHTNTNDYYSATVNPDGTVTLPNLLQPGDNVRWEVRIAAGIVTCRGKKFALNGLYQTYWDANAPTEYPDATDINKKGAAVYVIDPTTKQRVDVFPGLSIAIGDSVVVDDQSAIIVSPETTETYEVYGSKENLTFTLDFRANDLQTASDLSELVKQRLLVMSRQDMERDGITIFEAPRSFRSSQRDGSGTAPTFTVSLSVSASADWKVFVPKITRVARFEINDTMYLPDFQGKLQMAPRVQALGSTRFQFVRHYS